MCGIFGLALVKPVPILKVLRLLQKLEVHQYPQEPRPVGGYGAGIAILQENGKIVLEKAGKSDGSPAKQLTEVVDIGEASVLLGHVRMPSPEFMATARFKEAAQPYLVQRNPKLSVVSVHNGKVENYKEIRANLGKEHIFESEKIELIDSEVIPHLFGELLDENQKVDQAVYSLFCTLQGSSAIGLLQVGKEDRFIHVVHKGKTRGLTIWTNEHDELIFCSREEPLMEEFGDVLRRGKFKEKASIRYHEDVGFVFSHQLALK